MGSWADPSLAQFNGLKQFWHVNQWARLGAGRDVSGVRRSAHFTSV